MKVPGSDGSVQAPARVQDGRVSDASVNRKGSTERSGGGVRDGLVGELSKSQVDTMTISSLASLLRQELDPVRLAEERKAKVESIKERIRNGSYAPPAEAVASSVDEEISLEVLFGGDALQDGDSR